MHKTGENVKSLYHWTQTTKLPHLSETDEELNLYFAGALDFKWGKSLFDYELTHIQNFPRLKSDL